MASMFKILGADGKEYGPVTVDQVKQWVNEGRANHETMALKVGEFGWKPLAQFADLAGLFGTQPPALPTAPAGAAAAAAFRAPVAAAFRAPVADAFRAPVADDRDHALQLVKGPAIALLVTAILGMVGNAIGLIVNMVGRGFVPPAYGMNPEALRMMQMLSDPTFGAAIRIIPLAIGILVLVGALKMQKLRSRGLAMTTAILAMIPCVSPCCLLGLPFGIWALVVLSKPEVQSQFDR